MRKLIGWVVALVCLFVLLAISRLISKTVAILLHDGVGWDQLGASMLGAIAAMAFVVLGMIGCGWVYRSLFSGRVSLRVGKSQ